MAKAVNVVCGWNDSGGDAKGRLGGEFGRTGFLCSPLQMFRFKGGHWYSIIVTVLSDEAEDLIVVVAVLLLRGCSDIE